MSAYVEIAPPPALRPFVECLWVHRIDEPAARRRAAAAPERAVDLVWIGGHGVLVAGPQSRYSLRAGPAAGARLRRALPPRRGAVSPAHAGDRSWSTGPSPSTRSTRGSPARLDDRLGDARDARVALAAFGAELERRLRTLAPPPPAVREAVRMLDDGRSTVAETAARTFVSERALQRRFAQDVGYGPKVLQRVLRFQRFMRELAAPRVELARAGLLAGYADQSHLSRETRRLAGLSPRQLTRWQH